MGQESNHLILVYVTGPNTDDLKSLAKVLISKQFIACANILPGVLSLYQWNGSLAEDQEAVLIAKTLRVKLPQVQAVIDELHSYETPCVLNWNIDANSKFAAWVEKQCSGELGL